MLGISSKNSIQWNTQLSRFENKQTLLQNQDSIMNLEKAFKELPNLQKLILFKMIRMPLQLIFPPFTPDSTASLRKKINSAQTHGILFTLLLQNVSYH